MFNLLINHTLTLNFKLAIRSSKNIHHSGVNMKFLPLVLGLTFTVPAVAEVPFIIARDMTCEEVKQAVENYGKVKLKSRYLGLPSIGYHYREVICPEFSRPISYKFNTKDIRNCQAGYNCIGSGGRTRRPLNHRD